MAINILVVLSGQTGLQYHRQIVPHFAFARDPDFKISMTYNIDSESDDTLRGFQIVHFLRHIDASHTFRTHDIVNRLKGIGIKIVMDIDDFWYTDKSHALHRNYVKHNISKQTEDALELADLVTCTHDYLAEQIKEINANVEVVPNAINPEEPQFKIREIKNARVRFGWIGGVHHRPDVELLRLSLSKLYSDKTDKFQICLGGFNDNIKFSPDNVKELERFGCDIEHLKKLNGYKQIANYFLSKKLSPPIPEYFELEAILTDNHKGIKDKNYLEYLRQFTPAMDHISLDQPYRRLWGRDAYNYADMYNEIDVALVPLVNSEFNNCKSQLKIIEAGIMKKAVIVSNVYPYSIDCIGGKNCLTVGHNTNYPDWYLNIKKLINEPNLREDLAAALHETVKDKYHIKTVNELRKQLYKKLVE